MRRALVSSISLAVVAASSVAFADPPPAPSANDGPDLVAPVAPSSPSAPAPIPIPIVPNAVQPSAAPPPPPVPSAPASPSVSPTLPAPITSPSPAPIAPPADTSGVVRVHIDSLDEHLQLYRWGGVVARLRGRGNSISAVNDFVCRAPCDTIVDGRQGDEFYLAKDAVPWATPFHVQGYEGDLTIRPKPGNKPLQTTGMIFAGAGGLALVAGIVTLVGGSVMGTNASSVTASSTARDVRLAGGSMMGLGALSLIGGGVMMYVGRNHFEIVPSPMPRLVASR